MNNNDSAPQYAPPAYPPPRTDRVPGSSHLSHPGYIPRPDPSAPPQWEASVGEAQMVQLYPFGRYHDAGKNNFDRGVKFCEWHPHINPPQYVGYEHLDLLRTQGVKAWTVSPPSQFNGKITKERDGTIEIKTRYDPETDKTLVSSFPLLWGHYSPREGAKGVYYEVEIEKLGRDAVVAIGFGCLPYPTDFRLPGWHRHSAAVHSDDGFKFFENPMGGLPYTEPFRKGRMSSREENSLTAEIIGVGIYHPSSDNPSGAIFYTRNGYKLETAFSGTFFPRKDFDVHAMIGISGEVKVSINFGAGPRFKWQEGNEAGWKVGQENFEKPRV